MLQESEPEYSIKLLVLGDTSVGKSNYIYRFTEDKFSDNHMSTTGLDLKNADIIIDDKKIRVQLWDTAGEEKYRSITKTLFLRVQGIITIFDITKEETFINLKSWINSIKEECGNNMPILIIGNKCDLTEYRVVKKETAYKYAKKEKIEYIETSSKTGENIKNSVDIICSKVIKSLSLKNEFSFTLDSSALIPRKKKNCC